MPLTHGNMITAWSIPYLLNVGTIRELSTRPEDAFAEAGVKVSRREVFAVIGAASNVDHDSVAELRKTIARKPYHPLD